MFTRSTSALVFCNKLNDLINDHFQWSQATFGSVEARGPIGALKHLSKEAAEVVEAVKADDREAIRKELSDCFLLWLDAINRADFSFTEMVDASVEKMAENKSRTWPKPTASDEPVEHVRD